MVQMKGVSAWVVWVVVVTCSDHVGAALNTRATRMGGGNKDVGVGMDVGSLLKVLADQHLQECYLVLFTTQNNVGVFRPLSEGYHPSLLVDATRYYAQESYNSSSASPSPNYPATPSSSSYSASISSSSSPSSSSPPSSSSVSPPSSSSPASSSLVHGLAEGDGHFSCRVFLLDLTDQDSLASQLRLLEEFQLRLWPGDRVIGVGNLSLAPYLFTHHALINTPRAIYLALTPPPPPPPPTTPSPLSSRGLRAALKTSEGSENVSVKSVEVWWRCLYCNQGEADLILLHTWTRTHQITLTHTLFPDQFRTFYGHQFRIVSMNWFPFLSFTRDSDVPGTTVTPQDSLDYRMLTAAAAVLNFTYEMRVPLDDQWGVSTENGSWTGTVGTLQQQRADFSMLLSWMSSRLVAVDYTRPYLSEPLVIVTGKSGTLPQIFALIRPFPMNLWLSIMCVTVLVGVSMWALHCGWMRWVDDGSGREMTLSSAFLSTWGILLEDPVPRLPQNLTLQLVVGWWWVFCMLLVAAYRSSLVAHLSVPAKSPTIDDLEGLLRQEGWTWGMEGTYGIGWEWFRKSTVPTVARINEKIQALEADEHLSRVLQGGHAFLTWKYYIRTLIEATYTDPRGYTPLHIGRTEYINYGGYGWGFRKGAPFRRCFDLLQQRLIEAGLVNHWMNDLILQAAAKARTQDDHQAQDLPPATDEGGVGGGLVVLGLQQLQGAFYLLGLGFIIALVVLGLELLMLRRPNHQHAKHIN